MKKATIKKAAQTPELEPTESTYPSIYINGFEVVVNASDVALTGKLGDIAVGRFYMSHNLAKTIVELLGRTLVSYEDRTGITIMTTLDISERLERRAQENE